MKAKVKSARRVWHLDASQTCSINIAETGVGCHTPGGSYVADQENRHGFNFERASNFHANFNEFGMKLDEWGGIMGQRVKRMVH